MNRTSKFAAGITVTAALAIAISAAFAHSGETAMGPMHDSDAAAMHAAGPGMMQGMAPGAMGRGMGPGMMRGTGPGMGRGMGPGMMHGAGPGMEAGHAGHMDGAAANADPAFPADMSLVHDMLDGHDKIKRSVTNLPNGVRTVTESDDLEVAQAIKAHVRSMAKRLEDGKEFNLFSPTIPVLFENRDKIKTVIEMTDKGSVFLQTSTDPKIVAALQEHAVEVSELARDGMAAMMRGMAARMNSRSAQR